MLKCIPCILWITYYNYYTLLGWQSVSELYRVLHDLFTRQRFTSLNLIYLPGVQLAAISGVEPVNPYDELHRLQELEKIELARAYQDLLAGILSRPELPPDDDKQCEATLTIPGNFTSAVLTGDVRVMLEEELQAAADALDRAGLGYHFAAGWMLGITDCDQVSVIWLIDWSIDWLIDWLMDRLIDGSIDWWIDWLIDWLIAYLLKVE